MLHVVFFFFNDTATTEIYTTPDTLSLHDALPILKHLRTGDPSVARRDPHARFSGRSEEHTSELQSPVVISYAVFCLKKKKKGEDVVCWIAGLICLIGRWWV